MTAFTAIASWAVVLTALVVVVQAFVYIRKDKRRRPGTHLAIGLVGVMAAGLFFIQGVDPTNPLLPSAISFLVLAMLYLFHQLTRSDSEDFRLNDRIGRH